MAESDEVFQVHEGETVSQVKTKVTMKCKWRRGGGVRMTFTAGTELLYEAVFSKKAATKLAQDILEDQAAEDY